MKISRKLFWLSIALIGLKITACCPEGAYLPPPATLDFAIYDSNGEDNLFDEDGPYSIDSLQIFEEDGITKAEFFVQPELGGIFVQRYKESTSGGTVQNTYVVRIPNGEVDTLMGLFDFIEGDRCSSSFWTPDGIFYNGVDFTEENENGLVKVLREF